jgi:hypothetical protein
MQVVGSKPVHAGCRQQGASIRTEAMFRPNIETSVSAAVRPVIGNAPRGFPEWSGNTAFGVDAGLMAD